MTGADEISRAKTALASSVAGAPREDDANRESQPAAAPTHRPSLKSLVPGERTLGKYTVERVLGEGGMGQVFAVRHEGLDQLFAMKTLHPDLAQNASVRRKFSLEARAAANLESDCVARVFDTGELPDGSPYMVLEMLDGADLAAVADGGRKLPQGVVVAIALQVLDALAEAHAMSIVHRDLKPENIFVVGGDLADPKIKVLDFGVAKDLGRAHSTTGLVGTPHFIAPEQLSGTAIDGRADLWALGVTMYECLTGTVPFGGDTLEEIFAGILTRAPAALPPEIDPPLAAIVLRTLEKNPSARFDDAEAMAEALLPLVPRELASLVPRRWTARQRQSRVPETEKGPPGDSLDVPVVPNEPRKRSRGGLFVAIVATALVAAAIALTVAALGKRTAVPATTPAPSVVAAPAPTEAPADAPAASTIAAPPAAPSSAGPAEPQKSTLARDQKPVPRRAAPRPGPAPRRPGTTDPNFGY